MTKEEVIEKLRVAASAEEFEQVKSAIDELKAGVQQAQQAPAEQAEQAPAEAAQAATGQSAPAAQ